MVEESQTILQLPVKTSVADTDKLLFVSNAASANGGNVALVEVKTLTDTYSFTGYTGSQGYSGSIGVGVQGDMGYTGSQGDVGYTGSVGVGSQGDVGYTGSQGDVGYTGSSGGAPGITFTFTTPSGNTVTVTDGIITGVV